MTRLPDAIRWVVFDAVGTTIYPEPGVAEVYGQVAIAHGIILTPEETHARFRRALATQAAADRAANYRTSEIRERERWQAIVAEVLGDAAKAAAAFDPMWRHFAQPLAWRAFPDVAPVCTALRKQGIRLALASNFDSRLRPVVAGLPELHSCAKLIISSEVGHLKPSTQFFAKLLESLQATAGEVLFVGDDPANDFEAARAAGLHSVLLDRKASRETEDVVATLSSL